MRNVKVITSDNVRHNKVLWLECIYAICPPSVARHTSRRQLMHFMCHSATLAARQVFLCTLYTLTVELNIFEPPFLIMKLMKYRVTQFNSQFSPLYYFSKIQNQYFHLLNLFCNGQVDEYKWGSNGVCTQDGVSMNMALKPRPFKWKIGADIKHCPTQLLFLMTSISQFTLKVLF